MKQNKKHTTKRQPMEAALELTDFQAVRTDPQGSYTGVPSDPEERPVQDADDL